MTYQELEQLVLALPAADAMRLIQAVMDRLGDSQRESIQLAEKDFTQASEEAFARVWENEHDALYDKL